MPSSAARVGPEAARLAVEQRRGGELGAQLGAGRRRPAQGDAEARGIEAGELTAVGLAQRRQAREQLLRELR
jgi:hypothetical protein